LIFNRNSLGAYTAKITNMVFKSETGDRKRETGNNWLQT